MEELTTLNTEQLYDLLIKHTLEYTRLFNEDATGEKLAHYEYKLSFIQSEIIKRRKLKTE